MRRDGDRRDAEKKKNAESVFPSPLVVFFVSTSDVFEPFLRPSSLRFFETRFCREPSRVYASTTPTAAHASHSGSAGNTNRSSLCGRNEYAATKQSATRNTGRVLGSFNAPNGTKGVHVPKERGSAFVKYQRNGATPHSLLLFS